MALILVIVSNFYISIDPAYTGSLEWYQWSLCVLFPPFLSIIPIAISKSPSRTLFSFPSHLFCSPSKKRPLISCSLALCPQGSQTQRTLLLERIILKDTILPFGSVSTSVTPSRPGWSWPSNTFAWIFLGERKIGPNQLFIIWCTLSCLIWVSVKTLLSLWLQLDSNPQRLSS